ncbi:hypothetical protein HHX47_DHR3000754 [Lentinula edodes]|nr:hypothetical protein HHX47_DHR3000754 [Lentinula edodes]
MLDDSDQGVKDPGRFLPSQNGYSQPALSVPPSVLVRLTMIPTKVHYIASDNPSIPAFALQITQIVDSYMLWASPTELFEGDVERAPLSGSLCRDWACAMPPKAVFLSIDIQSYAGKLEVLLALEKGILQALKTLEK